MKDRVREASERFNAALPGGSDCIVEKLRATPETGADEIERLRSALVNLKEAVEYTPLGIRGLRAVEQARIVLGRGITHSCPVRSIRAER